MTVANEKDTDFPTMPPGDVASHEPSMAAGGREGASRRPIAPPGSGSRHQSGVVARGATPSEPASADAARLDAARPDAARPDAARLDAARPDAETTQLIPTPVRAEEPLAQEARSFEEARSIEDAPAFEEDPALDEDNQPTRMASSVVELPPPPPSRASFEAAPPPPPSRGSVKPALPSLSSLLDDESSLDGAVSEEFGGVPDRFVGVVLGDRYVIDRVIGEGGMGKVYRAHHKVIDKKVAVKILHAELAKDKESVGRFLREARAASSIGNPHIVDILDFGEAEDGSTYFVMEYLNGESLGDVLAERERLPATMTVDIGIQLCDGLAAAHGEGIVHRDLKPDNVILVKPKGTWAGQGYFAKILDFGIAKVSTHKGNTSKLTMAGAIFGTPHYMSPEQAAGEPVDHRTDIYSLGVMLYEMLVGEVPFKAENFMGILTQHMYKPPPSLRERTDDATVPGPLEAIILKCMAKRPESRYQTMDELAADLLSFKQTGSARATVDSIPAVEPAAPLRSQPSPSVGEPGRPRRNGLLAGAALVLLAAGAVLVARGSTAPAADERANAAPTARPTAVAATTPALAAKPASAVLLFSEIPEAYATVDGKRLKLPDTVSVPSGAKLSVKVEAGTEYVAKTIEVDGATSKVKIELERKPGAPGTASAATLPTAPVWRPNGVPSFGTRPPGPPKTNPKGVVDPW